MQRWAVLMTEARHHWRQVGKTRRRWLLVARMAMMVNLVTINQRRRSTIRIPGLKPLALSQKTREIANDLYINTISSSIKLPSTPP